MGPLKILAGVETAAAPERPLDMQFLGQLSRFLTGAEQEEALARWSAKMEPVSAPSAPSGGDAVPDVSGNESEHADYAEEEAKEDEIECDRFISHCTFHA